MKLIIAGSRNLTVSTGFIHNIIADKGVTEIVSGMADGIDTSAIKFVQNINNPEFGVYFCYPSPLPLIPFEVTKDDWNRLGKKAGPLRNKQMAEYGDSLLLIWDGKSKGSASMKKEMLKLKKPVYEVILRKHNLD